LILVLIMAVLSPVALALLIDGHGETEPGGTMPEHVELGFLAQDTPEEPTDSPEIAAVRDANGRTRTSGRDIGTSTRDWRTPG